MSDNVIRLEKLNKLLRGKWQRTVNSNSGLVDYYFYPKDEFTEDENSVYLMDNLREGFGRFFVDAHLKTENKITTFCITEVENDIIKMAIGSESISFHRVYALD